MVWSSKRKPDARFERGPPSSRLKAELELIIVSDDFFCRQLRVLNIAARRSLPVLTHEVERVEYEISEVFPFHNRIKHSVLE